MQRNRSGSTGYDYSEVGSARRRAIKTLDEYGCSSEEITAMFGVSKSTFHRYDRGVRLTRRPEPDGSRAPMSPIDARHIAMIALIRSGEYPVQVIAEALGLSVSTVYRERESYLDWIRTTPQHHKSQIQRYLKAQLSQDSRSRWQIIIESRQRALCKRRRGFGPRHEG